MRLWAERDMLTDATFSGCSQCVRMYEKTEEEKATNRTKVVGNMTADFCGTQHREWFLHYSKSKRTMVAMNLHHN